VSKNNDIRMIGLTQALGKLGVLGSGAVTQIKHSSNFCGYS